MELMYSLKITLWKSCQHCENFVNLCLLKKYKWKHSPTVTVTSKSQEMAIRIF